MADNDEILLINTPLPDEYKIVRIFGLATGLTARSRGIGGQFAAGFQVMGGGEISTYTVEIEKARFEALERLREKAQKLGGNAVVGIDFEMSTMGAADSIIVVAATGTVMRVEGRR